MNRNSRVFLLVLLGAILLAPQAFAQLSPHYPSGIEGIKASSLPPPGFYLLNYNVLYTADTLAGDHGEDVPVDFEVDVPVLVVRPVWVTKKKLFGANLAMDIVFPFVAADVSIGAAGIDDSMSGLADIAIEPFVLSWNRDRFDLATAFTFFVPNGDWDADRPASIGKDYWTEMFTLGGTYYFDHEKRWSASILARYEIHQDHRDLDISPGDDFHFEWGAGKRLTDALEVGLSGYAQWQITDDEGSDVTWDGTVHDRVYAIGPDINYFFKKPALLLSFRSHREFGAVSISEGWKTTVKLVKIF